MSEDRSVFELVALSSLEVIKYGDEPDQMIEVFRTSSGSSKSVLLIHGGYWRPEYDRSHLRPFAIKLAELGFETFLMEYRRIQGEPEKYVRDVRSALDLIGTCSVVGHSAGGHLALLIHKNSNVEKVIALAPVSDLVEGERLDLDQGAITEFLGGKATEYEQLDPIQHTGYSDAITIIHGDFDERVPVELSRAFHQKFSEIHFFELSGVGHFELIDPRKDAILAEVLRALN